MPTLSTVWNPGLVRLMGLQLPASGSPDQGSVNVESGRLVRLQSPVSGSPTQRSGGKLLSRKGVVNSELCPSTMPRAAQLQRAGQLGCSIEASQAWMKQKGAVESARCKCWPRKPQAIALTGMGYSAKIALTDEQLSRLRKRFGSLKPWWRDTFGYGFEGFTQSEARFVLNLRGQPTADALRARVDAARVRSVDGLGTGDDQDRGKRTPVEDGGKTFCWTSPLDTPTMGW